MLKNAGIALTLSIVEYAAIIWGEEVSRAHLKVPEVPVSKVKLILFAQQQC